MTISKMSIMATPSFHALDYQRFAPSVQYLIDNPLEINGAVGSTILQWNGKDASANGWREIGGAGTLTLQAGTAPTYNVVSPFSGSKDSGVAFNSGGYFRAPNNTLADITTEDFVIELVYYISSPGPGAAYLASHYTAAPARGWAINSDGAGTLYIRLYTALGITYMLASSAQNRWNHVICFCRRASQAGSYAYGRYQVQYAAYADTATVATPLTFGALSDGTTSVSASLYYFGLHTRAAGWLDSHLQPAIAAERYALLTKSKPAYSYSGVIYPTIPTGAVAGASPRSQKFENSTGLKKSYIWATTSSYPRVSSIIDANGKEFVGAEITPITANILLQSDTLGTTWSTINSAISANGAAACDGLTTLDGIVGDVNDTQHGIRQAVSYTAIGNWTFSAECRAGDKDFVYLEDKTSGDCWAYFQISTATCTSFGAGILDKGVINYGGGLIRPWIKFNISSAPHTLDAYAALADGDNTFAGDASTPNIWLGAMQLEPTRYPSVRTPTTTAAAYVYSETLHYVLVPGSDVSNTEGALYFEFWAPVFTPGRVHYLCSLSVGTVITNSIRTWIDTNGRINLATASTGGSSRTGSVVESSGSRCDNVSHTCLVTWRYDELKLYIDNVLIGTDTTFDPPTGLTRLNIGIDPTETTENQRTLNSAPALISNVQIFPYYHKYNIIK